MIGFSPANPFPMIDPAHVNIGASHRHSAACDKWLGLNVEPTERMLAVHGCRGRTPHASGEKQKIWIGLEPQMLLTPYIEIRWWLERLQIKPSQIVSDLGAAYGRMGFVLARHFSECSFIGYEYVGERVSAGKRALEKFGANKSRLEHVDLASPEFVPAPADFYFLYDFGTEKAIEKILYDLKRISRHRAVTLVTRGRHCRYMIDRNHKWLTNAFAGEPEGRVTIYSSISSPLGSRRGPLPFASPSTDSKHA